jgi:hypothetical protein
MGCDHLTEFNHGSDDGVTQHELMPESANSGCQRGYVGAGCCLVVFLDFAHLVDQPRRERGGHDAQRRHSARRSNPTQEPYESVSHMSDTDQFKVPTLRPECGTLPGWQAHWDAGERACLLCRKVKGLDLKSSEPLTLATDLKAVFSGQTILTRFPARFDSRCDACKGPMVKGDLIGRTATGMYVCGECGA